MLMLTFKTRRITRAQWKVLWRQTRIIARESRRAQQDMFLFGTGFLEIGPGVPDHIRCVPPEDIWITPNGQPEIRS